MQCLTNKNWAWIYSRSWHEHVFLKKVQEGEVFIFLIDTAKLTMNIQNLMTQNKNQNNLYT